MSGHGLAKIRLVDAILGAAPSLDLCSSENVKTLLSVREEMRRKCLADDITGVARRLFLFYQPAGPQLACVPDPYNNVRVSRIGGPTAKGPINLNNTRRI